MLIKKYLSNTSRSQVLIISTIQYLITMMIFSILIIQDEQRNFWWINSTTIASINLSLVVLKVFITINSKSCFNHENKMSLIYFFVMEILFYIFMIIGSLMSHYHLNAYFFSLNLSWLTADGKASLLALAFMILWAVFFTMLSTFVIVLFYSLTYITKKYILKVNMFFGINAPQLVIHSASLITVFLLTILVYFFSWITYLYMIPVVITSCSLLGGLNYYVFDKIADKPFLYKRP